MAKKKKGQLTYFLDHPSIKRNPCPGNGESPAPKSSGSTFLGGTQTSGQKGGITQGTKGASGGTGNIKTNLGKLLGGK